MHGNFRGTADLSENEVSARIRPFGRTQAWFLGGGRSECAGRGRINGSRVV